MLEFAVLDATKPHRPNSICAYARTRVAVLFSGALIPLSSDPKYPSDLATSAPESGASNAYRDALDYLYGRINYEKSGHAPYTKQNYRLDRMRRLLERLGDPQRKYSIVHIAGTKGKGTVAHLTAHCLAESGISCGLATSPHLWRLEERFCMNGQPASPTQLAELTTQVRRAAEDVAGSGQGYPTFFELTTAMALLHFAQQSADWAVVEVGLGGRLDSTNVCEPKICVLTSISLDHQKQLGSTIAQIAKEKAGIIKPGVPVIAVARKSDARDVICQVAEAQDSELLLIERDFTAKWEALPQRCSVQAESEAPTFARVSYESEPKLPLLEDGIQVETKLLGAHQADNIAATLMVLEQLYSKFGCVLNGASIKTAVSGCAIPARLEVTSTQPLQILDTAHNPASLEAGFSALQAHFPKHKWITVFASSKDKDWRSMLRQAITRSTALILTAYRNNPRAVPVEELRREAAEMKTEEPEGSEVLTENSPAEAWCTAVELQREKNAAGESHLVYATGSFFLVAELPRED